MHSNELLLIALLLIYSAIFWAAEKFLVQRLSLLIPVRCRRRRCRALFLEKISSFRQGFASVDFAFWLRTDLISGSRENNDLVVKAVQAQSHFYFSWISEGLQIN